MKELTSRQWALYNFLRNHPNEVFTQENIAFELHQWYSICDTSPTFHDSPARYKMMNDIRAINESPVIQKIIIQDRHGIRLASQTGFEMWIKREYASIFRKLKRTHQKARKAGLNNQMRFVFGSERETIEAFSDTINPMKAARLAAGLKLADVVKTLRPVVPYLDVPLLSKMENGYCNPSNKLLLSLAALYQTEPSNIVGGELIEDAEIS